jgi:hypothetical protein
MRSLSLDRASEAFERRGAVPWRRNIADAITLPRFTSGALAGYASSRLTVKRKSTIPDDAIDVAKLSTQSDQVQIW